MRRASKDSTAGEAGTLAVEGESARIDRGGGSWRAVVCGGEGRHKNEAVALGGRVGR